jgi:hypothetical protein
MTTTAVTTGERVWALARVELRRYALHPVFLVGLAINVVVETMALTHRRDSLLEPPVGPAFLLGVLGMVVGFRMTRSLERTTEALASTPVDVTQRVGALCLACLLPGLVGLLTGVSILVFAEQNGDWGYGTWAGHERVAIVLGQTAVASLGGPLLGVACARWLRFPGAAVVPVVGITTWAVVTNGWTASNQDSMGWLLTRMFSPFAFFHTLDTDPGQPHAVESWRGNPEWFLLWLVMLCAFAALVALLKGAEGATRLTLKRLLVAVVVVAIGSYALAVTTGPDHATKRDVHGVTRI